MEFQLLGSVTAAHAGVRLELGRRQERCLLALLLLEPGRVVSSERLLNLLWNDNPPASGRGALYTYVARLRAALGEHGLRIIGGNNGYAIEVDRMAVDVHRFGALLARAHQDVDPGRRSQRLRQALDLWHGPLMADVADDKLRERLGAALAEQRLTAIEHKAEADLARGHPEDVAAELGAMVVEHPGRERMVELLMVALYRAGRAGDALAAFRSLREHLVTELGIEPTPALERTHQLILRNDASLRDATPSALTFRARRYLPRDVPDFTGRVDDLARLDELAAEDPATSGAVVITAIAGLGGIGKTALAVRWAHRHAGRFPDGQLYLDLDGYSGESSVRPAEALRRLLRELGIDADRIPVDADEAAVLYRSVLTGLKVLIILDNAGSVEQVRPLLPTGAGILVLVTSRDRLSGLVARDGARRMTLDAMREDEALELLRRLVGADRVHADPVGAAELAAFCGFVPLALRIAGTNLAEMPGLPVSGYVSQLHDMGRLRALAVEDDPRSTMELVLAMSLRNLPESARHLFRLLGVMPGRHFSADAVTALAARPTAANDLGRLADAHLIAEGAEGTFRLHDLVRDYAVHLSCELGPDATADALLRLARWQLDGAWRAQLVIPHLYLRHDFSVGHGHGFADPAAAQAWLDRELDTMIAGVDTLARLGRHAEAWRLAYSVRPELRRRSRWGDWLHCARIGLAAATADGDLLGQAVMRECLGAVHQERQDHQLTMEHLTEAVRLFDLVGDPVGAAVGHDALGVEHQRRGDLARAQRHHRLARRVAGYLDVPMNAVRSRTHMGTLYGRLGRYCDAIAEFKAVVELAERHGDHLTACYAHHNLAFAYILMARPDEAADEARAEIALARRIGSPERMARGFELLGDALADADSPDAADAYDQAVAMYARNHDPRGHLLADRIGPGAAPSRTAPVAVTVRCSSARPPESPCSCSTP